MSHCTTKPAKWPKGPAKAQIRLGGSVWSESMGSQGPMHFHADSEDPDQTGRTGHFVGFVVLQLISETPRLLQASVAGQAGLSLTW